MVRAELVRVPRSQKIERSVPEGDVATGYFFVGLGVAAFLGSVAMGVLGVAPLAYAVAGAGLSLADIALQYKGFLEPALKERSKR